MQIDVSVWDRLNERFTPEERARLFELDAVHYPERCDLVEAMRGGPRPDDWYRADLYADDRHRYSARFRNPAGAQVVCGGADARPTPENKFDDRLRSWTYVSGEFNAH